MTPIEFWWCLETDDEQEFTDDDVVEELKEQYPDEVDPDHMQKFLAKYGNEARIGNA